MDYQELLKKYIEGKAGREETKQLLDYLIAHPDEKVPGFVEQVWKEANAQTGEEAMYEEIFQNLEQKIQTPKPVNFSARHRHLPKRRNPLIYWFTIAASLTVLLVSVYLINQSLQPQKKDVVSKPQPEVVTHANPEGQKTQFYLPDGSSVWLNAGSTLRFQKSFEGKTRDVKLEGEAYFEVQHNPAKPFRVHSEKVVTEALGTSFNVRAYPEESKVNVALNTGKVRVDYDEEDDSGQNLVLKPGDGAIFNKEKRSLQSFQFNPKKEFGWKEGLILFEQASFDEVFDELKRWYGVEFTFISQPQDPNWKYTGEFEKQPLSNVLQSIGYTKKFDYRISKKKVRITFL
ncbi:FecR domain-containing protein [Rapidithrix thailandica]|uniref:FecR domain-containing protein n=1 Tax=Rapidithrix thailandica TaxID=413964 RepID=A0AAW9RX82_9BACT